MKREEIGEKLQGVLADLTRMRDEARVQLNLLGKDLRDRWADLDDQIDQVIRLAKDTSEAALERASDLRDELRNELQKRRDQGAEPPAAPR